MEKNVIIVIPTYNEYNNIVPLIEQIQKEISTINHRSSAGSRPRREKFTVSLLFVDDYSPDGTGEMIKAYTKKYNNIHLIEGKKQGLGAAYIRGFGYAMNTLHASYVIEMDADLSHDPTDLSRLIDAGGSHTLVIGSRYIPGSDISTDWPWYRRTISKVANLVARHIAGIRGIHDCTSGFRMIPTGILKKIQVENMGVSGYGFQMAVVYEALRLKERVIEIPIHFGERAEGVSKMSLYDIAEFIWTAFRCCFYTYIGNRQRVYGFILKTIGFMALAFLVGLTTLVLMGELPARAIGYAVFALVCLFITAHSLFTLWGMIYAWEEPERVEHNRSPKQFLPAEKSFTALVPALHEEAVIAETVRMIAAIDYPEHLKEILIICRKNDYGTIQEVNRIIDELGKNYIRLLLPSVMPKSKPDNLNYGLRNATNEVVCIFDAEDAPHKDIFNIVNTVMNGEDVDVVQSGVQLMNFRSRWFSMFNVLEYYFWFKSVLHMFANKCVIPLGGNTVFFKKEWLLKVKGWDTHCLTEDADIGMTLSLAGARVRVIYDEQHATQEETPVDIMTFIKQRTRWNQGFIQIFKKKRWKELPTLSQKLLMVYILIWPEVQAAMFVYIFFSVIMMFTVKLPVFLALISFFPLYLLALHLVILNIGLYEFTKNYHLKYSPWLAVKMILTFIPFQLLLGVSALRAVYREIMNQNSWEKTAHVNAHRVALPILRANT